MRSDPLEDLPGCFRKKSVLMAGALLGLASVAAYQYWRNRH